MKKTAAYTLILVCLMALSTVCSRPVKAQTLSAIIINANGTVTPSAAPIEQIGSIYALTSDFVGRITVNRSNSMIDGKHHSLSGGLLIQGVSNVTVEDFVIADGEFFGDNGVTGILLDNALQVAVTNNTISGIWSIQFLNGEGFYGIDVSGGGLNIISGNNLTDNFIGMYFEGSSYNLIVQNNFTNNPLAFWDASNNTIYHNNFFNSGGDDGNTVEYPNSSNAWDGGYPKGGNYWSDYEAIYKNINQHNVTEIDDSGIGDTPYYIDAKNNDRYPLVQPFSSAFYALQTATPKIFIMSPLNQTYKASSIALTFSVDVLSLVKIVNWTGYSLDGHTNVTIASNSPVANVTIANVTKGLHSITVYANDSYGNMGASTIAFTVALLEPFPTVAVAAASVASVAVVCAGIIVYLRRLKDRKTSP